MSRASKARLPSGATGCHLRTSQVRARTYGRSSMSDSVGSRSFPITLSISFCAFSCTSGKHIIARKKAQVVDTVWNVIFSVAANGVSKSG